MQNIFELVGDIIFIDDNKYYALNIIEKGLKYFCFGINIESESLDNTAQVLELSLTNGELMGSVYSGDDYQSLLDEFMEAENLRVGLEFMKIQRDTLNHS